jgi:MutS domain V/MutS domain III
MQDLKHLYADRHAASTAALDQANKNLRALAMARLAVAIVFIFFGYLSFSNSNWVYALPILAAVFFYLVRRYNTAFKRSQVLENLVTLNRLEGKALDFDYSNFKPGKQYVDPHHSYSHDLDLFGNGSVFQYLNRCGTEIGEDKLASWLLRPQPSAQPIMERQEAVRELHDKIEFRQDFWANAMLNKGSVSEIKKVLDWLKEESLFEGKTGYKILLIAGPVITLSTVALAIIDNAWLPLMFAATGVQWAIASYHSKNITNTQLALGKHKQVLEKYSALLKLVSIETFASSEWQVLKEQAVEAGAKVQEFSKLVNALESRMNFFATVFGNALFLNDLHSVRRLEQWRHINGGHLPRWLDTISEADVLCALGTFHFNNPSYVFPKISDELGIEAQSLGHPLIAPSHRVDNDFSQGNPETIMIVTGANMAGKSTFLRAVGVNMVLALAGAPVCAKTFSCPIIGLRSGMRTTDSLQENQSYFYAELFRLKRIMDELREGKPLLILLDEILKGTNSNDKQSGSIAIVEQLVTLNGLVLLATHDVALGDLQQRFPTKVSNVCFESEVDGDRLTFDYKLKKGVAQKANATFLMREMGIIPRQN